jgi:hypothetical protein
VPAAELSRRNREALRQMRVPDPIADRFLANRLPSPRHQTVIVEAMKVLHGVARRATFIQYAARADSEDAALLYQEMAELLAGYHRLVAPTQRPTIYRKDGHPARWSVGRGPLSDNCVDRGSDDAVSNPVDCPIRQCIPDFGLPIIRPENGCSGGQHTDHIYGGGNQSDPSHLAGEYDDSLEEIPEHRPSPFPATAAERRTGD